MEGKLAPRIGIVILLGASTMLAANHVCARIAFDHGATVATGVAVRASSTALILLAVMRLQGLPLAVPQGMRVQMLVAGILLASQSYCLYSAVAALPPALALLVFQTSPMLYVLLTWGLGKEKPRWNALGPMGVALAGLALALNLDPARLDARWSEIGPGVAWALGGGASMTLVYFMNANALKPLDVRLRTCIMTAITAAIVIAGGAAAGALVAPRDLTGFAGLALLAGFYCLAMLALFGTLPRLPATSSVALNFEPIALLVLGWLVLGNTVTPLQTLGAFLTVGAIAWLGLQKSA